MIDFQDMEQFALQILTEEKDGSLVPSAVAREYQEQFEEVMIDEYQDSNLIQGSDSDQCVYCEPRKLQCVYGRRCQTEYLPFPPLQTGTVYGKI